MPIGYCVKCRKMKEMKSFHTITSGKRKRIAGVCSKCGTNMSKFI